MSQRSAFLSDLQSRARHYGIAPEHLPSLRGLFADAWDAGHREGAKVNGELLEACKAVDAHLTTTFPPYKEGESPYHKVRVATKNAETRQ